MKSETQKERNTDLYKGLYSNVGVWENDNKTKFEKEAAGALTAMNSV
jgi:hypothetical protein